MEPILTTPEEKSASVTGQDYRLPSEAEWEYAARAGTTTSFWWGSSISAQQANYDGTYTDRDDKKSEYRQKTVPVKSFEPNAWGLYQVHGNVWEWCADSWHEAYRGAPVDGSVWIEAGDASRRVLRGGSWSDNPSSLRSAYRDWLSSGFRNFVYGVRVARTLKP